MIRRLLLLLLPVAAFADDWAPNLTLAATWHDNATHANLASDEISALQTSAEMIAADRFAFGRDDTFFAKLHAAGEWWPRYRRLSSAAIGVRGEWQHKFGLGPLAPVLSLEGGADWFGAQDGARDGTHAMGNVSVRKRFNEQWQATLSHDITKHYARAAVYDRRGDQTSLELGFDATELLRVTATVFRYRGDVVSYATPPRPELAALATAREPSAIFNRDHIVYSIDGRTLGGRVAAIRAVSEDTAMILSYEYRETERDAFRYVNHLVSVAFVNQF